MQIKWALLKLKETWQYLKCKPNVVAAEAKRWCMPVRTLPALTIRLNRSFVHFALTMNLRATIIGPGPSLHLVETLKMIGKVSEVKYRRLFRRARNGLKHTMSCARWSKQQLRLLKSLPKSKYALQGRKLLYSDFWHLTNNHCSPCSKSSPRFMRSTSSLLRLMKTSLEWNSTALNSTNLRKYSIVISSLATLPLLFCGITILE